ncbi:MAG TPA: hypothetical protein VFZ72_11620 [Jiangellaceae bacterium]
MLFSSLGARLTRRLVVAVPAAVALMASSAVAVSGGLERVGATDYDLPFTSRNTEIEIRGDHVYVGSFSPLDEQGQTAFKVADVSDPTAPQLATHFMLPGAVLDTQVNNDVDRCGYGKDLRGLDDPACNTVLATTQSAPGDDDGVWLFDIRDPAAAEPWGWDSAESFRDQVGFIRRPAAGSHNGFLFGDYAFAGGIGEASFEIWDISPLFEAEPQPPVLAATYSSLADPRPVRPQVDRERSHDLFVQRSPDGRVLAYIAGPQFYVVDVTDVVEGTTRGDISDHLVAFNNYVNADGALTVDGFTTGSNGHYAEPTDDGRHTYVGDEVGCGQPGIIHIFDTADLPQVGETPEQVEEVGVLSWPTSNAPMCSNRNADEHNPTGNNRNGDVTNLARTGHNFRIYGDVMTHGAYFDGVFVWDLTNRTSPTLLAQYKAAGGEECHDKRAETPEEKRLYRLCGSFWQAVSDGDPDALLAGDQLIYGSDRAGGLVVLRMRPTS